MEATSFFETSGLTRPTRRHILEDGILHSHRLEDLKSTDLLFVNEHGSCGSLVLELI
jgi:hypothetical protein